MAGGLAYFQAAAQASAPDLDPPVLDPWVLDPPALAAEAALVATVAAAPVAAAVALVAAAAAGARAGPSPSVRWLPPWLSLLAVLPWAPAAAVRSLRECPSAPRFRSRRTAGGSLSTRPG